MSAALSAVADQPIGDSIDTTDAWTFQPQSVPTTEPHATETHPAEPHGGRVPDAGIDREPTVAIEPDAAGVDDLSRGGCGARIDPAVNQRLRAELSGYDDESELGDDDSSPGSVNDDDDDLDEFDEIDEDDFDDEFDDDFEEELEDEYEIEIEDEISAEFGLGPDKDDEDEELDDLDSLADDLNEDIDDDLKD